MEFISGLGFHNISKWCLDNRYPEIFEANNIEENDLVFLNTDFFDYFVEKLKHNKLKNKFILITGNSDRKFTENHYIIIKDFINKIYAINSEYTNDQVKQIPIGFQDNKIVIIKNFVQEYDFNIENKSILLHMNFRVWTNPDKRTYCFNIFKDKSWVVNESELEINQYYSQLIKTKYSLSPEGAGVDCHRIYECLYFNVIPIVKNSILDNLYRDLPVIIVSEWDEINENFLIENYQKNSEKLKIWKKNNPLWMTPEFWIK
jgi:hypothetical protein